MTFSKKIIFIALIGLMTACSTQNTTSTMTPKQCPHQQGQDCCKNGCDKCQECLKGNGECAKCQSEKNGAAGLLLNKQSSKVKCEHHK